MVGAAVGAGEALCGHCGWESGWCGCADIVWLLGLLEVGWRGAIVMVGVVDGFVVVLCVVLCASGATVCGFGILSAAIGGPFGWGWVLVVAW